MGASIVFCVQKSFESAPVQLSMSLSGSPRSCRMAADV